MKALIITSDENAIYELKNYFSLKNIDTIIYKWLLKALDNIEEIQPDFVIVSSEEYPRHWKTLVQFIKSGIGGENIKIFLLEKESFSKDEESKVNALAINGIIANTNKNTLDLYFDKLNGQENNTKLPLSKDLEEANEVELPNVADIVKSNNENIPGTGKFIFTNPSSNTFISGDYFDYNGNSLTCNIDCQDLIPGEKITHFTIFDNKICKSFIAELSDKLSFNDKKLSIFKIREFYEEE